MAEHSLFWDGSVLGDCGPYTQQHFHDWFYRTVFNGDDNRGPIRGWRDELLVSGTSSPITVAAGGAVVYGGLYDSDAATSVAVSTPSSGFSRYDRIVVRRDWSAQTIRIARVTGTAAAIPAVPALTQTALITWEIPLATLLIDDAGTITVTDTREFCAPATEWPANCVVAGMFAEGAVTAAIRPDRTRTETRGANEIRPNSANGCTRVAGASYDYWQFADAVFNRGWAYFMAPVGLVGTLDFYVWSTPDVNGAGAGAENAQWDYSIYYGNADAIPTNVAASTNVDQQLRVNTRFYYDAFATAIPATAGDLIAVRLSRDGAADSYNSAMRVHAITMSWTAQA